MMTQVIGELVGTAFLIVLGCGVNAGVTLNKSHVKGAGWLVVAFGWGFAVTMAVYAVGQISGAHINPAVTLGFAMAGAFPWSDVAPYIIAQVAGAILGATIVYFHYLPHWRATEDKASKLGVFSTSPGIRLPFSNLLSEIIGTFVLVAGLMAIGSNEFTEGLNPLIVGFLILSIGISLGGTTGYAINPARDLGPRIAHFILPIFGKGDSDWSYSWIPVLGPIIGGIYGALFYQTVFDGVVTLSFWIFTGLVLIVIVAAKIGEAKPQSGA